jgi:hypothetical protein
MSTVADETLKEADRLAELSDRIADLGAALRNANSCDTIAAADDVMLAAHKAGLPEAADDIITELVGVIKRNLGVGSTTKAYRSRLLWVASCIETILEWEDFTNLRSEK